MNRLLVAVVLISLLFAGCISLGGNPPQPSPNITPPQPKQQPSFTIVEPVAGDTILASDDTADVSVVLSIQNLSIKPTGTTNNPGEGHFRISLDDGAFVSFFSRSYTMQGVGLGAHTIKIELDNNDNTPYYPPLTHSVTFEVTPAHTEYVAQTYEVDISNFNYDPQNITIKAGDSIDFVNQGSYPRSATSTGNFDTNVIAPGGSAKVTFTKEGTFGYFSLTYNLMRGTVTVESNGSDVEPQPAQTQNPAAGTSQQGYQIIKFKVSQDTPASKAAGTNSMYNDIYLDLASHRYFQSVYDGSGADLYFNGTYYKVSKLAEMDQCYVSSANEDFPTNLNRDEILDIGAFLLVETLKSKAGSDSGEFVNNYLKNVGPDEYALTGVNQFQNSVFRKYGDTYLGSNVTYKYGSLVYNYVYSDIQPVSSGDFDAALSQEISKWNNCKDVSGGPNPLP